MKQSYPFGSRHLNISITAISAVLLSNLLTIMPAFSQMGVSVTPVPTQANTAKTTGTQLTGTMLQEIPKIPVTGKNLSRADNMLLLYTPEFGKTTNTNPYGVEIVATPIKAPGSLTVVDQNAQYYKVDKLASIWECQKSGKVSDCGNIAIPQNGIVLSASGDKRQSLLNYFQPGQVFALNESWFQDSTYNVNVLNPNSSNNSIGCSFPGCRGGQQLVIYNRDYGKPTTLTNEYGFEVTVRNGIVVEHEGSDSVIPVEGDPLTNFVVSGHGNARNWLTGNAPIGAKLTLSPDGKTVTSHVGYDTYIYQLDQRLSESRCLKPGNQCSHHFTQLQKEVVQKRQQADQLMAKGQEGAAVRLIMSTLEDVNQSLWREFPAYPATAVKGVWHRPVEQTPLEITRTLDKLHQAGLNTIFLESVFHGYTIFPSNTMASYGLPKQNPKFEGMDALKLWVEEAHKRNMQVHVWMHTFYSGTKTILAPGPILTKYPQWANVQYSALVVKKLENDKKTENGKEAITPDATQVLTGSASSSLPLPTMEDSMKAVVPAAPAVKYETPKQPVSSTLETGLYFSDPANPDVQKFILALSKEIVTKYDVDGLNLDYIRYPASFPKDRFSYLKTTWGYTDVAREAFKKQAGIDPVEIDYKKQPDLWHQWETFKAEQVTKVVKSVYDMTRNVNQGQRKNHPVILSAVIFPNPNSAIEQKSQDWMAWGSNHYVDMLTPITLTSAVKVVSQDTQTVLSETRNQVPVAMGVFGAFNGNSAELLLQQIDAAKTAGAQNFSIFDSAHLTGRMMQALSVSQGQTDRAPVPH